MNAYVPRTLSYSHETRLDRNLTHAYMNSQSQMTQERRTIVPPGAKDTEKGVCEKRSYSPDPM